MMSRRCTADLSDTFSVRKMQLLGGQRPPQDFLASQRLAHVPWGGLWPPKRLWGGLWPPKSCIFLTENVSDKSAVRWDMVTGLVLNVSARMTLNEKLD